MVPGVVSGCCCGAQGRRLQVGATPFRARRLSRRPPAVCEFQALTSACAGASQITNGSNGLAPRITSIRPAADGTIRRTSRKEDVEPAGREVPSEEKIFQPLNGRPPDLIPPHLF